MQQEVSQSSDIARTSEPGALKAWRSKLLIADETFSLFKNLSIVGLVGTIVGSYFQWVSWREEQNIARYKQDFDAATAVFSEAGAVLSTAMNQQQLVYFNYTAAKPWTGVDNQFLTKSGRDVYKTYVDARNFLRQNVDPLGRKLEIYIDWPSDPNRAFTVQRSSDPLNSRAFGDYTFNCENDAPDASSIEALRQTILVANTNPGAKPLRIDWGSTKHHIITFQFCFERIHSLILPAREWASGNPVTSAAIDQEKVGTLLNKLVDRYSAFMLLTMWQIENIRHRYQTKNYACHLFPVAQWCS